jgi:hypothetical protein
VRHLPRESSTHQKLAGDGAQWGVTEHLLALMADSLRAANWQRGGGKGQRPRPLPRPGHDDKDVTTIKGKSRTMAEMKAHMAAKWARNDELERAAGNGC